MNGFTLRAMTALTALAALPASLSAAQPDVVDIPPVATYGTNEIPTSLIVPLGLNCNLPDDLNLTCYATEKAALDALESGEVSAAASCTPPMQLYNGASFLGASINIATQSVWVNLSTYGFNNVTSSWKTGCAGGYLADGTGGSGLTIGMAANSQQASLGSFNNLASSARRCPC